MVDLPDPIGLGWDVSGTVTEVGDDVAHLSPGDRVAGLLLLFALKTSTWSRPPRFRSLRSPHVRPRPARPGAGRMLLVTGGAGAVGGHAIALAARAGWRVTALARASDADFVARAGAVPVTELPGPSFDAVLDAAVLLESALGAVRNGGSFVRVAPAAPVAARRGIDVQTLNAVPDGAALAELLVLAAAGTLEVRVAGRVPLHEAARAYDEVARGGHRGRWLLIP